MQATDIGKLIEDYLDRLDTVADRWINWLERIEALTFENNEAASAEVHSESPQLMKDLERIVSERKSILQQASALGLRANNLTALADILPKKTRSGLRGRITESQAKTSYLRRLHYAVWVMVHQSLQYSNDVLRLITSGKSAPDVYSTQRTHRPEGGRLLNTET
jgi:hypothetical protein